MAMTRPSPSGDVNLENEAGRELAAFLQAVKESQGPETAEKAGTIWIDILASRPQTSFCSQSSFRSITVEAVCSLVSLLGHAQPKRHGGPEYEAACADQANSRRIHLAAVPAERANCAQHARNSMPFLDENLCHAGAAGGLELAS